MRTILLASILMAGLHADDDRSKDRSGTCTAETIKGTYGYTLSGVGPNGQIIGLGVRTYDGQGNFTQADTVVNGLNGTTVDVAATGTYTVNPNCTGTWYLTAPGLPTIQVRFVIVNQGKEIRWLVLSQAGAPPAATVTGHAVRQ